LEYIIDSTALDPYLLAPIELKPEAIEHAASPNNSFPAPVNPPTIEPVSLPAFIKPILPSSLSCLLGTNVSTTFFLF